MDFRLEEILKAIGNYGFPIVISAYLLMRLEGKLDRVAASISELSVAVRSLSDEREEAKCNARYADRSG